MMMKVHNNFKILVVLLGGGEGRRDWISLLAKQELPDVLTGISLKTWRKSYELNIHSVVTPAPYFWP